MIIIKSQREINLMREAGRIVAQVFDELEKFMKVFQKQYARQLMM